MTKLSEIDNYGSKPKFAAQFICKTRTIVHCHSAVVPRTYVTDDRLKSKNINLWEPSSFHDYLEPFNSSTVVNAPNMQILLPYAPFQVILYEAAERVVRLLTSA